MSIQEVQLTHFRNIECATVKPGPGLNFLYGNNGSGKSSFLEALQVASTLKSFRSSQLSELIQFRSPAFLIRVLFESESFGKTRLGIRKSNDRSSPDVRINDESIRRTSELAAVFPIITLEPNGINLIEGSPGVRRRWLDMTLFHVEQSFYQNWKRFSLALQQRNALLKQSKHGLQSDASELLGAWEREMIAPTLVLDSLRVAMCESIEYYANQLIVKKFLDYLEPISLIYRPGSDLGDSYQSQLERARERDRSLGFTQHGPHRAEVEIRCNSLLVRDYFSRGQKKLLTYALRLALVEVIAVRGRVYPVTLIDDLFSELDAEIIRILGDHFGSWKYGQIFITSTTRGGMAAEFVSTLKPKMFHVEHGVLVEDKVS